jgi:hypothetical protein
LERLQLTARMNPLHNKFNARNRISLFSR